MLSLAMAACAALAALYAVRRANRDACSLAALLAALAASLGAQRLIPLDTALGIWAANVLLLLRIVALPVVAWTALARVQARTAGNVGAAVLVVALGMRWHYGAAFPLERLDIAASVVSVLAMLLWAYRGRGERKASLTAVQCMVVVDAVVMVAYLGAYETADAWDIRSNSYLAGCAMVAVILLGGLAWKR